MRDRGLPGHHARAAVAAQAEGEFQRRLFSRLGGTVADVEVAVNSLIDGVEQLRQTSEASGRRIEHLTTWLVWLTIVLAVLAIVQIGTALA